MIFALTEKKAETLIENYGPNIVAFDLTGKSPDLSMCGVSYDPCKILPDQDLINEAINSKKVEKYAKKAVKKALKALNGEKGMDGDFVSNMTMLMHILISRDTVPSDLSSKGAQKYMSRFESAPVVVLLLLPEINENGDLSKDEIKLNKNLVKFYKVYLSGLFGLYGYAVLTGKDAKVIIKDLFDDEFSKKRVRKLWRAVNDSRKKGTGLTVNKQGMALYAIGYNIYAIESVGAAVIAGTKNQEEWNVSRREVKSYVGDLLDCFTGCNIPKLLNFGVKTKVLRSVKDRNKTIVGYYNEIRDALLAEADAYAESELGNVEETVNAQIDAEIERINEKIETLKDRRSGFKKKSDKYKKYTSKIDKQKSKRKKLDSKKYRKKAVKEAKKAVKQFNPFHLPKIKYGNTKKSRKEFAQTGKLSVLNPKMDTDAFIKYFADKDTHNDCALAMVIAHIKCRMDGRGMGSTKYNKILNDTIVAVTHGNTDTAKRIVGLLKKYASNTAKSED